MKTFEFSSTSENDTMRLGQALAEVLPPGITIALLGTLGAGKTRLVQALAAALKIPEHVVTSPTFVICQEYHGSRTLYHLDAYRIKDDDEFLELGVDEYYESNGITLIEWADRIASCLPPDHLEIRIEIIGECERLFQVEGRGAKAEELTKRLACAVLDT